MCLTPLWHWLHAGLHRVPRDALGRVTWTRGSVQVDAMTHTEEWLGIVEGPSPRPQNQAGFSAVPWRRHRSLTLLTISHCCVLSRQLLSFPTTGLGCGWQGSEGLSTLALPGLDVRVQLTSACVQPSPLVQGSCPHHCSLPRTLFSYSSESCDWSAYNQERWLHHEGSPHTLVHLTSP